MCRFVDGKLERTIQNIDSTDYVTISHVWGQAEWQKIPMLGDDCEVIVSKEKARFMSRLNSIVKTDYFWMDILCVEQRDKAARVAVTRNIPTIFRHAKKTIVIRDGNGFRDCCTGALGSQDTWFDRKNRQLIFAKRLEAHHERAHKGEDFQESVTSRLWVFQEIIMSNRLQFVRCEDVPARRYDVQLPALSIVLLCRKLYHLSQSWESYAEPGRPNDATDTTIAFLRAFFYCNTNPISRSSMPRVPPTLPTADNLYELMASTHRTTKARDFILAVMPQYVFYHVPHNAKEMSFTELFRDCCVQLETESQTYRDSIGIRLNPGPPRWSPSIQHVSEPIFLGDLAKIFYGQKMAFRRRSTALPFRHFRGFGVHVRDTSHLTNLEILRCIRQSMRDSERLWSLAINYGDVVEFTRGRDVGDLGYIDRTPEQKAFQQEIIGPEVYALVTVLWKIYAELSIPDPLDPDQDRLFDSVDPQSLLHMTALISCGLAASSFTFSKCHRIPVLVDVGDRFYLAVVDRSVYMNVREFLLAKADDDWLGTKYALTIEIEDDHGWSYRVYPFPPDADVGRIHGKSLRCKCWPRPCQVQYDLGESIDGFRFTYTTGS
jgi:hypothetical protein